MGGGIIVDWTGPTHQSSCDAVAAVPGSNSHCSVIQGKSREYEGLIVIASLIDRLPNLGGLCRKGLGLIFTLAILFQGFGSN